jgi:hypothetical protein
MKFTIISGLSFEKPLAFSIRISAFRVSKIFLNCQNMINLIIFLFGSFRLGYCVEIEKTSRSRLTYNQKLLT